MSPASPRTTARIAGALYLVIIVAALFAEVFVRGRLVVPSAAATAANILAHQTLYRLGGASDLLAFVCDAGVAFLFYELFKPVSRTLSLTAAGFRLLHVAVAGVNTLNHFAPLVFLGNAPWLAPLAMDQRQTLARAALSLHATGYNIALIFFGLHCVFLGILIFRSPMFPRILGALITLSGLCYLANSFAYLLSPPLQNLLYPWVLLPGGVSELALTLWLLIAGVHNQSPQSLQPLTPSTSSPAC